MSKNKNLQETSEQNFILKGSNSVQIGVYIVLTALVLESSLSAYLSDVSFFAFFSIQLIEGINSAVIVLAIILASLAVFYSSRRRARKQESKIWNSVSKRHALVYFILVIVGLALVKVLLNLGYINYLTPAFLVYFGFGLALLNSKKLKEHYLLSVLCALLAIIVILIPSYWNASLLILGGAVFVYGVVVK